MFALTLDLPTLPVKWAEGVSFKPVAGQNEAGILNSWGNLRAFTIMVLWRKSLSQGGINSPCH